MAFDQTTWVPWVPVFVYTCNCYWTYHGVYQYIIWDSQKKWLGSVSKIKNMDSGKAAQAVKIRDCYEFMSNDCQETELDGWMHQMH